MNTKRAKTGEKTEESILKKKPVKDEKSEMTDFDFEILAPSQSFFHMIKLLLTNLLDGAKFDVSGLSDHILNISALGALPASCLNFDMDVKYQDLSDAEYEQKRVMHNKEREVFGVTTIVRYSLFLEKDPFK